MMTRFARALMILPAASLAWTQSPQLTTAIDVEFHEARPLAKLTFQLTQHSGLLITYEEAPYDEATELFTDTYANGRRFRYPAWRPITFHGILPPLSGSPKDSGSTETAPAIAAAIAESAVAEYNASGNPGKFKVVRDGDYVHILPAGRLRNGRVEPFDPILDTKVTFTDPAPRRCGEVLNDLIAQIKNLRGVQIVDIIPTGALMRLQCRIEGADLTARDAFKQFLQQIEAPQQNPIARFRYSWTMGYDVNEDLYFLKIDAVTLPSSPALAAPSTASPAAPAAPSTRHLAGSTPGDKAAPSK